MFDLFRSFKARFFVAGVETGSAFVIFSSGVRNGSSFVLSCSLDGPGSPSSF